MKSKLILLAMFIAFISQAQTPQLPFTYEGFDYNSGTQINGQTGGFGWQGGWQTSTGAEAAYTVTTTNPFTYTNGANLPITPGRMIGSSTGNIIGRYLNTATNGPYANYLDANGSIAYKPGSVQLLFFSFFMTKNQNDNDQVYISFTNGLESANIANPTISFGYFGPNSNNSNGKFWTIKVGNNYLVTTSPMVAGEKVYFVMSFNSNYTINGYIGGVFKNPLIQNTFWPSGIINPVINNTLYSEFLRPFKSLMFYSEGTGGSFDEILAGPTFTSVGLNILPPTVLNGVNGSGNGTPGTSTTLNDTWRMNGNSATDPATQFLGTTDYKDLNIKTNNQNRVIINKDGNVSISGVITASGIFIPITNGAGKVLTSNANGAATWQTPSASSQWVSAGNDISFITGKITIGTQLPGVTDYKLSVDGKLMAKSVVSNTSGWFDHVFEKDYDLISIDKLDEYIQKNQKLPEIPSAKEVSEKGIDLAQISGLLLQKLEEQSLYIIDLQKRIKTLEKNSKK